MNGPAATVPCPGPDQRPERQPAEDAGHAERRRPAAAVSRARGHHGRVSSQGVTRRASGTATAASAVSATAPATAGRTEVQQVGHVRPG